MADHETGVRASLLQRLSLNQRAPIDRVLAMKAEMHIATVSGYEEVGSLLVLS